MGAPAAPSPCINSRREERLRADDCRRERRGRKDSPSSARGINPEDARMTTSLMQ